MFEIHSEAPRLISQLIEYGFAPVPPTPLPHEWQHVYNAVSAVKGDRHDRLAAFLHSLPGLPNSQAIYSAVYSASPFAENEQRPERRVHSAEKALSPPPVIDWFVQGLFTRPSLNLIVGNPGTKKTYLALDLAVCVALGKPWLGRPTQANPVLIVDEETGLPRLWARLHSVLHAHQAPPETPLHFISLGGYDLHQRKEADSLAQQAQALGAGLIIIDALVDVLAGGDENSVPSVQPVLLNLRWLSEACQAAVDLMLEVQSQTGAPLIYFRPLKARTAPPLPFTARTNFQNSNSAEERFWLTPTDEQPPAESIHQVRSAATAILDFLAHNGQATTAQLTSIDAGVPGHIRNVVHQLMATGLIDRVNGGAKGKTAIFRLSAKGQNIVKSGTVKL